MKTSREKDPDQLFECVEDVRKGPQRLTALMLSRVFTGKAHKALIQQTWVHFPKVKAAVLKSHKLVLKPYRQVL